MEKKLKDVPEVEKVVKKKVTTVKVKNTTVQKIELVVDNVLVVFAPGETKELPKDTQVPDRVGLIII